MTSGARSTAPRPRSSAMMAARRKRRRPTYRRPGRQRRGAGAGAAEPATRRRLAARRRHASARRPHGGASPWSSWSILIGLVLLLVGFFVARRAGSMMIACGVTLASLAGLELSVREHLAGYRSHSTVLAGVGDRRGAGRRLLPAAHQPLRCSTS